MCSPSADNALHVRRVSTINKKHTELSLSNGEQVQLLITQMFDIQMWHAGAQIGSVRFEPLSSLNNLEMPPLYRISRYEAPAGRLSLLAQTLLESAVQMYAEYTCGTIRPYGAPAVMTAA